MAELSFSRRDIEGLVDKLSALSSQLSDQEQRLLLAIFSVAADHARRPASAGSADVPADATLAGLREQIVRSFVPGSDEAFFIQGSATKIGPDS
jgi:hypothetical protein